MARTKPSAVLMAQAVAIAREQLRSEHAARTRAGMKAAKARGINVGRPRHPDYARIASAVRRNVSPTLIAQVLGCPVGTVGQIKCTLGLGKTLRPGHQPKGKKS